MVLPVDDAIRPKAQRWMRALQRQIRAVWLAQSEHLRDAANAEAVAVSLALAATAIRVLDREVFDARHSTNYRAERDTVPGGAVVNGITLVRDAEIHLPAVVTPFSEPVVGSFVPEKSRSRTHYIFWNATWQLYERLPIEVQRNSRTAARCHKGYREGLQGRAVTETLLEAFCFFRLLDPSIVARDDHGEIDGFPLPPARGMLEAYHRLHPDEPPQDDVSRRLEKAAMERSPGGKWREIRFAFRASGDDSILRFAGYQDSPGTIAGSCKNVGPWVDYRGLMLCDVRRGYKYWLLVEGVRHRVTSQGNMLLAEGTELSKFPIPNAPERPDWWQIGYTASMDTFEHCRRRDLYWYDVVSQNDLRVER